MVQFSIYEFQKEIAMSIAVNYSSTPRFDIIEYVKRLRNAGVTQEVAEIQGQEIERILEFTINNAKSELQLAQVTFKEELKAKDIATKSDVRESELRLQKEIVTIKMELEIKIASIKSDLLKWQIGGGITATIVILGGMFTMLKLMIHV